MSPILSGGSWQSTAVLALVLAMLQIRHPSQQQMSPGETFLQDRQNRNPSLKCREHDEADAAGRYRLYRDRRSAPCASRTLASRGVCSSKTPASPSRLRSIGLSSVSERAEAEEVLDCRHPLLNRRHCLRLRALPPLSFCTLLLCCI